MLGGWRGWQLLAALVLAGGLAPWRDTPGMHTCFDMTVGCL